MLGRESYSPAPDIPARSSTLAEDRTYRAVSAPSNVAAVVSVICQSLNAMQYPGLRLVGKLGISSTSGVEEEIES